MKVFDRDKVRTVGLFGAGGAGKTSLGEAFAFVAGTNSRLGKVEQETSTLDFEDEEIKRKGSTSAAVTYADWNDHRIFIIDTPGDANFCADAYNVLRVVDCAIFVIDSVDGVKIQASKLWDEATEQGIPKMIIVTKSDKERANFKATLKDIENSFSARPVPLTMPNGEEDKFTGVLDILNQKALIFKSDESGKFDTEDVPDELKSQVEKIREQAIEAIVEADDGLMERYLDGGEIKNEELFKALKAGVVAGTFVPVLTASGVKNIAVPQVLDNIIHCVPNPTERPALKGTDSKSGDETERKPSQDEPFSAFVFKTTVDPFAGKLSIFRVFSGTLTPDSNIYNTTKEEKERIGQIFLLKGKGHEAMGNVYPGDIAAAPKTRESETGDTLCAESGAIAYPPLRKIPTAISFAITPISKGDEEKVASGLSKLMDEDTSLTVHRDPQTQEFILSGLGQLHVETTVAKLKRKYGVEVSLSAPSVPYRETIKKSAKAEGKYKRQSGGRGQFGVCWLELSPLPEGDGFEFVDKIVGGVIPNNFRPAVKKGVQEAMEKGVIAGFPVVGVKVTLFDGKHHPVDSSEMAFKIAGSMGFKNAAKEAKVVILEPIMKMEVATPEDAMGTVIGDLNQRRGKVLGMDTKGNNQIIKAQVPMAEVLKYSPDLRSMTAGRGSFTMEMSHYDEVPAQIAEKIIAMSRKDEEEEQPA